MVSHTSAARPAATPPRRRPVIGLAVVGALVAAGLIVALRARTPAPRPAPPRVVAPPPPIPRPPSPPPAPSEPPRLTLEGIESNRTPMLVDVDADGTVDAVAAASFQQGPRRWRGYGAWSGASGELVWQVETRAAIVAAAVAHGRLLLLADGGQLEGYDLHAAKPQWSTALGDRGLYFCAAREPDAVEVAVADERRLVIDVKTGRQTPAAAAHRCDPVPTDEERRRDDPRDRTDPRAPAGTAAYLCGTVRVMGSQSYVVPDACAARAHIDSDRLDGMVAHALWQTPQGWLAPGVRSPGTPTPVLALLKGSGRILWKVDVPDGNPLEARTGGPRPLLLAPERAIAGWSSAKEGTTSLAAFALADGKRLWQVALPVSNVGDAQLAGGRIWIAAQRQLVILDAASGAPVRTLGR